VLILLYAAWPDFSAIASATLVQLTRHVFDLALC